MSAYERRISDWSSYVCSSDLARYPHIEGRHRRGVDEAQPDAFARREQSGPIVLRPVAIDDVGISRTRRVGNIGWIHPHLGPIDANLQRSAERRVGKESVSTGGSRGAPYLNKNRQ